MGRNMANSFCRRNFPTEFDVGWVQTSLNLFLNFSQRKLFCYWSLCERKESMWGFLFYHLALYFIYIVIEENKLKKKL